MLCVNLVGHYFCEKQRYFPLTKNIELRGRGKGFSQEKPEGDGSAAYQLAGRVMAYLGDDG